MALAAFPFCWKSTLDVACCWQHLPAVGNICLVLATPAPCWQHLRDGPPLLCALQETAAKQAHSLDFEEGKIKCEVSTCMHCAAQPSAGVCCSTATNDAKRVSWG